MLPLYETNFASSGWHLVGLAMIFALVIVVILMRVFPR